MLDRRNPAGAAGTLTLILLALTLPALPGLARAQSGAGAESQRMTLPRGKLLAQAFLEINLSADAALKPVSFAPDVWYGVTDELSLGLVHSASGAAGFYGGVGSSLCLTGADSGCDGVYRNVGLTARYNVMDQGLALAVTGGVHVRDIDPFQLALQVGATGRWLAGPVALVFHPSLFVGITERDAGNQEVLALPVSAMYDATERLAVGLQTGVILPFADIGNLWQVPLSLGARFALTETIWLDGAFSLPAVVGGDGLVTGLDARTLTIGGGAVL